MQSHITLYELNRIVRSTVETVICDEYWVHAELSEVRQSRGHCYLEFVQKDEHRNILIAKARGQIWAGRWAVINPYFVRTTGLNLSPGMQVLVCVQVTFHELYGYSLNVIDIDPTYTLGDIARRRQEIIRTLESEGVLAMNKELPLPTLLQRIAVISSPTAAGYGDFCSQLNGNKKGLSFSFRLFPAVMQGEQVEQSVISALDAIAANIDAWDAVVIIRGGGSTSDLYGFDTLALAENVAQFPLPVISGIGHERDDTIVDIVAHTRVKTPTAAAEFLIHHQEMQLDRLSFFAERLARSVHACLHTEHIRLQRVAGVIPSLFHVFRTREEARMERMLLSSGNIALQRMSLSCHTLQNMERHVCNWAERSLLNERHRLSLLENKVESASPDKLLKLGFSVTRVNGRALTDASQVKKGDVVVTTLASGEIVSVVK
ncbi:MAG: exodeoxyribonuclease VII large subunit [Prevotellaceae bacterium]|nr:exodeoxyribonuclease VII large subunit [Prevotellaceae bacterium]